MIHHGDCRAVMATMPEASIDAIVTDPPYGLEFMGKGWDKGASGTEFWVEALRVAKPGAHLLAFGGTRTYHRLVCAIEDAGWEIRDQIAWLYGQGFPKSLNVSKAIDKAAGAAKQWDGWGTALKPAVEPIVLARKPLIGTVAENVLTHGTGGLNIDACRVPFASKSDQATAFPGGKLTSHGAGALAGPGQAQDVVRSGFEAERSTRGRWPSNLILDEKAGAMLDAQSGITTSTRTGVGVGKGDTGGASRFFYCPKASRSERGEGNTHPTVKPVALMRYLVRLVTPPGGVVLDPFMGSGTTGLACKEEGFGFVGIEQEAEYTGIAKDRLGEDAATTEIVVDSVVREAK